MTLSDKSTPDTSAPVIVNKVLATFALATTAISLSQGSIIAGSTAGAMMVLFAANIGFKTVRSVRKGDIGYFDAAKKMSFALSLLVLGDIVGCKAMQSLENYADTKIAHITTYQNIRHDAFAKILDGASSTHNEKNYYHSSSLKTWDRPEERTMVIDTVLVSRGDKVVIDLMGRNLPSNSEGRFACTEVRPEEVRCDKVSDIVAPK